MKLFTWPVIMAGAMIAFILGAIGRIFAFFFGAALAGIGAFLCVTIIGLIIGIPLITFGGALMARSIF